jgi:hypothetical protein
LANPTLEAFPVTCAHRRLQILPGRNLGPQRRERQGQGSKDDKSLNDPTAHTIGIGIEL